MISIPVSVGELIDKLSILQVKKNNIKDNKKLSEVEKEFNVLNDFSKEFFQNKEIDEIYKSLIEVNSKLWDVEDKLRIFEKNQKFDQEFIELARLVYYTNDERFSLKNKINQMTNSELKEQKSYEDYKTQNSDGKKTYIYESPDGGKTVYRREFGKSHETRERTK
jgi:Family of unknown function (DUF6165)